MTKLNTVEEKAKAFDRILQSAMDRGLTRYEIPMHAAPQIISAMGTMQGNNKNLQEHVERMRAAEANYNVELQELFPNEAIGNPMGFAIQKVKHLDGFAVDAKNLLEYMATLDISDADIAEKGDMPGDLARKVIEKYKKRWESVVKEAEAYHALREFGNEIELFKGYDVESEKDIPKVFEMEIRYMRSELNDLRDHLLKHTPLTLNDESPVQGVIKELQNLSTYITNLENSNEREQKDRLELGEKLDNVRKDREQLIAWNKELQAGYADLFPNDKASGSIHALVLRKLEQLKDSHKHEQYAKDFENKWKATRSEARRWKDKHGLAMIDQAYNKERLESIIRQKGETIAVLGEKISEQHAKHQEELNGHMDDFIALEKNHEQCKKELRHHMDRADEMKDKLKASKKKLKGYKSIRATQRTQEQRITVARGIVSKLALSKHMDAEMLKLGLAVLSDTLAIGETDAEKSRGNGIIGNVWSALAGEKPKTSTLDQLDAARYAVPASGEPEAQKESNPNPAALESAALALNNLKNKHNLHSNDKLAIGIAIGYLEKALRNE